MFNIDVEGKTFTTIIKDKQVHRVSREFMHIDFQELHKGVAITVSIPIKYVGEPEGVKEGGLLDVLVREIELSCLPKDIPEGFEVDITNLKLDESIHLKDVNLGGYDLKLPEETTLVSVRLPRGASEDEAEETEEGEAVEETATSEE